MELKKKNIKELGKMLNGYYLGGNVYEYENQVFYIRHGQTDKITNDEIKSILKSNKWYYVSAFQVAYSKGYYGNTGQLHKIEFYTEENTKEPKKSIFVYYC